MKKLQTCKGTYGYLNQNKKRAWVKAFLMLLVPFLILIAGWAVNKTRLNPVTVAAVVLSLPGCNQVVHAIIASRYRSMDPVLYEETEAARGDCLALYESVLTSYEETFTVDCLVISGRDIAGYTSDPKTNGDRAGEHIKKMLRANSYKQNVKIFTEKKAFLERVRGLAERTPEEVPFKEDDRYPGLGRDEIIQYLIMAISL